MLPKFLNRLLQLVTGEQSPPPLPWEKPGFPGSKSEQDDKIQSLVEGASQDHASALTPDCWEHGHVYAYLSGKAELAEGRIRHLAECRRCQRVVLAAYPNTEWLKKLIAKIAPVGPQDPAILAAPAPSDLTATPAAGLDQIATAAPLVVDLTAPAPVAASEQGLFSNLRWEAWPVPDRYTKEEFMGDGVLCRVYKAKDLKEGRDVVIKMAVLDAVLRESWRKNKQKLEEIGKMDGLRFVKTFAVAESLSDGSSKVEAFAYQVEEFMQGGSLQLRLKEQRENLSEDVILRWLDAVACGVEDLGKVKGHLHIEPSNILFPSNDLASEPKLTDLGFGEVLGTRPELFFAGSSQPRPIYQAPEQLYSQLDKIGPATDVWALALVAAECFTREPVLMAASLAEARDRISEDKWRNTCLDLESKLGRFAPSICGALRLDPAERTSSPKALANALRAS